MMKHDPPENTQSGQAPIDELVALLETAHRSRDGTDYDVAVEKARALFPVIGTAIDKTMTLVTEGRNGRLLDTGQRARVLSLFAQFPYLSEAYNYTIGQASCPERIIREDGMRYTRVINLYEN